MKRTSIGERCAVLLDRDGVLNAAVVVGGVPHPPAGARGLSLLPGVLEACIRLRDAGFLLVCVTNQPDIARGDCDPAVVDEINHSLAILLGLEGVLVCPHDDGDGCDCRKPRPGLLLSAARKWSLRLEESVMVGDRWRDVEAGRRAGCRTVFVDHGYAERVPEHPDLVVDSLLGAVPWILSTARASLASEETRACPP